MMKEAREQSYVCRMADLLYILQIHKAAGYPSLSTIYLCEACRIFDTDELVAGLIAMGFDIKCETVAHYQWKGDVLKDINTFQLASQVWPRDGFMDEMAGSDGRMRDE